MEHQQDCFRGNDSLTTDHCFDSSTSFRPYWTRRTVVGGQFLKLIYKERFGVQIVKYERRI